jgi:hypothetical protein
MKEMPMKRQEISTRKRGHKPPIPGTAASGGVSPTARLDGDARGSGRTQIDPPGRRLLIAQAAYFRAEKRGFAPGRELQDWFEAKAEIERLVDS